MYHCVFLQVERSSSSSVSSKQRTIVSPVRRKQEQAITCWWLQSFRSCSHQTSIWIAHLSIAKVFHWWDIDKASQVYYTERLRDLWILGKKKNYHCSIMYWNNTSNRNCYILLVVRLFPKIQLYACTNFILVV